MNETPVTPAPPFKPILMTNLILACGHLLIGEVYIPLDHKMGELAWCPTCGATSITEVEPTYEFLRGDNS